MKKLTIVGLSISLSVLGFIYFLSPSTNNASADEIVVYQSRTCGCCKKWVSHLRENGFKVRSELMDDVTGVKQKMNIPRKLASCHTAVIGGYIVEGHVPSSAVKKLLSERPNIKGISVPGMPMGSPGMEGSYQESYDVIAFEENGPEAIYMSF